MRRFLLIGLLFLIVAVRSKAEIVVLNNPGDRIPIKSLPGLSIASVHLNFGQSSVFDSIARKYWGITSFDGDTLRDEAGFNGLHDKLKFYNTVFLEFSGATVFSPQLTAFVRDLATRTSVFLVLAGDGNKLSPLGDLGLPLIWYDNDNAAAASLAAQALFGGVSITSRLPAGFGPKYPKGAGYSTKKIRLGYSIPEAVGINSADLAVVDSIIYAGIAAHSAPAAVIVLVKDGQVIYSKAFGNHRYWGNEPTKLDDIFDMASCTKVTATTPSIMHLCESRQISLDSPISRYVARLRSIPDKRDQKVREALLHEAGFTPYIKFYEGLKPADTSPDSSAAYPTKIADGYYLRAGFFDDTQWPLTLASPVLTRGKFVYSDLSMYMMKEVFENVSHQRLNEYVLNDLYLPLGMQSTGFLPRSRFPKERIVITTENDNWFRSMPVQGYVDDPGAAMAGGVEGHAGLFASANDLAIFYQMLLNGGTYGGKKYFDSATVHYFTSRQSTTSQRGLGFDRVNPEKPAPGLRHASELAFGHSGYTGTYVWVDPKYKIVFICLTNRTYPDDGKTFGIPKVNIRALTLNAYYDAVIKAAK